MQKIHLISFRIITNPWSARAGSYTVHTTKHSHHHCTKEACQTLGTISNIRKPMFRLYGTMVKQYFAWLHWLPHLVDILVSNQLELLLFGAKRFDPWPYHVTMCTMVTMVKPWYMRYMLYGHHQSHHWDPYFDIF